MIEADAQRHLGWVEVVKILVCIAPLVFIFISYLSLKSQRIELRNQLADIRRESCNCLDDMSMASKNPGGVSALSNYELETIKLCDEKSWIGFDKLVQSHPKLVEGLGIWDRLLMTIGGLVDFAEDDEYESDTNFSLVEAQIDRDYGMMMSCFKGMGFDVSPYQDDP